MKSTSIVLRLLGLAALLAAAAAQAQGNGPLTGNMGATAAQPAASVQATTPAQAAAPAPLQAITLSPAQPVAQATTAQSRIAQSTMAQATTAQFTTAQSTTAQSTQAQGGITDRPVVRQVSTPLPIAQAPSQADAPQAGAASRPADEDTRDGHGALVRALLAAQADGRRAGPPLPMLGPVATASWDRYLESFKHPIPEWFRERVEAQGSGN